MATSLPHVSSEGGAFLFGDLEALKVWRGANSDVHSKLVLSSDVKRFEIGPIEFDQSKAVVWETRGIGTIFLASHQSDRLTFVQFWANKQLTDQEIVNLSSHDPGDPISETPLPIPSGVLVAIWSAEDVTEASFSTEPSAQIKGLALGDGGWKFSVDPGEYVASTYNYFTDKIEVAALRFEKRSPPEITQPKVRPNAARAREERRLPERQKSLFLPL
jgi:hypothetical protein